MWSDVVISHTAPLNLCGGSLQLIDVVVVVEFSKRPQCARFHTWLIISISG